MSTLTLNLFYTTAVPSLAKLSSLSSAIAIIVANTTPQYLVLFSFISASLAGNFFRNLIYKVLNLGLMSIFVAALWAYKTDVNFIYVVYVLAFVGAVVMLFLSVILMLPSSAVAVSTRLSILPAQSLSNLTETGTLLTFLYKSFIAVLLLIILFVILYILLVRSSIKKDPVPTATVPVFLADAAGGKADSLRWAMDNYAATHNFYAYEDYALNSIAVAFYDKKYTLFNINKCGKNFVGNAETSSYRPLLLVSVPKVQTQYSYNGNLIATIVYEFSEFYVRTVEPYFFQISSSHRNPLVYLTIFMRKFIGARHFGSKYDLRNYLVRGCQRLALKTVSQDTNQDIIIIPHTPWWSPFNVSKKLFVNRDTSFSIFKSTSLSGFFDFSATPLSRIFSKCKALYCSYAPSLPNTMLLAFRNNEKTYHYFTSTWILHGLEYFIFKYVDSKLFVNRAAHNFRSISYTSPVWNFLEKFYYPAQPVRAAKYSRFPHNILPQISMRYEPTEFISVAEGAFPILLEPSIGKYYTDVNCVFKSYNKLLFILNFILFLTMNLFLHLGLLVLSAPSRVQSRHLDAATQSITLISIYTLAVPLHYVRSDNSQAFNAVVDSAENLKAIQEGLYVNNPMLLLVSVCGLLVALIGAAVIKNQGNNT